MVNQGAAGRCVVQIARFEAPLVAHAAASLDFRSFDSLAYP